MWLFNKGLGEGCPPPAKQAKLSRYGFASSQTPGSTLNEDGDASAATASDSGTRDQETDELESPEPRSSSSSSLLTDGGGGGGGGSRSSAESSTESAHELGKSS
jgi:hypothetical protein